MSRPIMLDLYCGAGGAAVGYHRAGWDVVGWDIVPQPRYPFEFHLGNALDVDLTAFGATAVHASPPCKVHTDLKAMSGAHHIDLIPQTRDMLANSGLPYVIENVEGAPLLDPVWLCGSMFGLGVLRHRQFELGRWKVDEQPECRHAEQAAASPMYPTKRYHSGQARIVMSPVVGVYGGGQGLGPGEVDLWRTAMGIPWMTRRELAEAIPPAYAEWIGNRLMAHVRAVAA